MNWKRAEFVDSSSLVIETRFDSKKVEICRSIDETVNSPRKFHHVKRWQIILTGSTTKPDDGEGILSNKKKFVTSLKHF